MDYSSLTRNQLQDILDAHDHHEGPDDGCECYILRQQIRLKPMCGCCKDIDEQIDKHVIGTPKEIVRSGQSPGILEEDRDRHRMIEQENTLGPTGLWGGGED